MLTNTTKTNYYIETGTLQGLGMMHVLNEYNHIHSIELSEYYYNYCNDKYGNISKIHLHHGDSKQILPR